MSGRSAGGAAVGPATVPVSLLREAVGHVVQVELASHDAYRGTLAQVDANMNATLTKVTHTAANARQSKLEEVFLRGSAVRLFVLPAVLANAPVLRHAAAAREAAAERAAAAAGAKQSGAGAADAARKRQRTA